MMVAEGVACRYAMPIFWAVRAFGWIFYRKNISKSAA